MGLFSRFENKAEDVIEGGSGRGKGGIEPVKLCKRAFKEMQREKMVGVGHEYAPTLYNVLLSPEDDSKMNGYYPSLAGEIETYLTGKAETEGLVFDCAPLVRFIVDDGLKRGRFDIIAESVSPAIIAELREEEMQHYGIKPLQPLPIVDAKSDPFAARAERPEPVVAQVQPMPQPQPVEEQPVVAAQPAASYDTPIYEPAEHPAASYDTPDWNAANDSPRPVVAEPVVAQPAEQPAARIYPPTEVSPRPLVEPTANEVDPDSSAKTILLGTPAPRVPQASLYEFATKVRHPLVGPRVIIGRGTTCDVIVSDPSVSRHHAELLHDESGWLIRDTGSTNGTNVNGAHATQSYIYSGDIISLGTAELEFQEG